MWRLSPGRQVRKARASRLALSQATRVGRLYRSDVDGGLWANAPMSGSVRVMTTVNVTLDEWLTFDRSVHDLPMSRAGELGQPVPARSGQE
jgi:hypothetical protein